MTIQRFFNLTDDERKTRLGCPSPQAVIISHTDDWTMNWSPPHMTTHNEDHVHDLGPTLRNYIGQSRFFSCFARMLPWMEIWRPTYQERVPCKIVSWLQEIIFSSRYLQIETTAKHSRCNRWTRDYSREEVEVLEILWRSPMMIVWVTNSYGIFHKLEEKMVYVKALMWSMKKSK